MIVIATSLIGIAWGLRTATKRGGNRLDKLQYAAAAGIAGLLVGMIATVVLERLL